MSASPEDRDHEALDPGAGPADGTRQGARRHRRRPRPSTLAWVLWAVVVTLVVTPLVSSSQHDIGPGVVDISVRPSWGGRTTLSFPPLGRVSAHTHDGPVRLTAELREIDVQPVIRSGGRLDTETLSSSVRKDLGGAVTSAAIRIVVVGAVVGALAVTILPRRRLRRIVGGGLVGALSISVLMATAIPGFDPSRFEEPTYEGSLAMGGSLLNSLTTGKSSGVSARVDVLAEKLANLYSASITNRIAGSEGDVAILHVSDLHLNPIGVELTRQMAESFGVDAIIDTGDTTSFGLPFEQPFSELFDDFDVPYYFVAGNHDSLENRAAIGQARGVTAIDRRVIDVEGVRILGFDDPVITTTRTVPREERDRIREAAEPELVRLVEEEQPDVVATHNPAMASAVAGKVPLVIAGHLHRSVLSAEDGTLVSVVGSTGATGLGSLTVEAEQTYVAQVLRFRGGDLVAVDAIELSGTMGDFVVRRTLITDAIVAGKPADVLDDDPEEPTLEALQLDEDGNPIDPDSTTTTNAGSSSTTLGPTTTDPGG